MAPRPPIPPGPPQPAGDPGSSHGGTPPPGTPDAGDKGDKPEKKIPSNLSGYGFDKQAVRELIEKYFRVYEERDALPGFERALLVAFFVLAEREDIEAQLPALNKDLEALDPQLMPMLREEGGETLIVVTRRPRESRETRSHLPPLLLLLTLVTVTLAGSMAWMSYGGEHRLVAMFEWDNLLNGFLSYTVPLLAFFIVIELGRIVVAKRHRITLRRSLLIPVPPVLFIPPLGVLGGITHLRGAAPNRRALFDLAAAGPFVGFLTALVIVAIGMGMTLTSAVERPDDVELRMEVTAPDGTVWQEGDNGLFDPFERSVPEEPHYAHNITVTFRLNTADRGYGHEPWRIDIVPIGTGREPVNFTLDWQALGAEDTVLAGNQSAGAVESQENVSVVFALPQDTRVLEATLVYDVPDRTTVPLGEPLAFTVLSDLIIGDEDRFVLHPTGLAGWTALLVTGIMLLPVGRLDGGGISRSILGERMTILSWITLMGLAVLTLFYAGWVYLILIIVLFLTMRHPMPLEDTTPLDRKRYWVALLMVAILLVTFVPLPTQLPGVGFLT